MFKKSILFLLVAMSIMLASCAKEEPGEEATPMPEWDGNLEVGAESKPETDAEGNITIKTPAEFVWFAHSVNGTLNESGVYQSSLEKGSWSERINNPGRKDYAGKTVKLEMESDGINLNSKEWPMIGRAENVATDQNVGTSTPFKGTFDGNGKEIKNLTITKAKGKAIGLFGRAEAGALIKNVKLTGTILVEGTGHVAGILGEGIGESYHDTVNVDTTKLVRLANVSLQGIGEIKALANSTRSGGVAAFIVFGEVVFAHNTGIAINSADTSYTAGIVACVHGGVVKYAYNSANIKNTVGGAGTGGVTAHSRPYNSGTKNAKFTGKSPQETFNVFNKGPIDTQQARPYGGVIANHSMGNIVGSFNLGILEDNGRSDIGQIIGFAGAFGGSDTTDITIGKNYYLKTAGVQKAYGSTSGITASPATGEGVSDTLKPAADLNESAGSIEGPFKPTGGEIWRGVGSGNDVVFNTTVVREMTDRLYTAAK